MRLKQGVFVCLLLLGIFLSFIPQVVGQSTDPPSGNSQCQQTTILSWFKKPPNDRLFCLQWNFGDRFGINLEEAWNATKLRGENVKVALLEPAIHYTEGADFLPDTFLNGYDYENRQDIKDPQKDLKELSSHGTLDAAIISQDTNNGKGSAGIADLTKIIPYRIPDINRHYSDEAATADAIKRGEEQGADIINISLDDSSEENYAEIQKQAKQAYDKNVLLVVASGNLRPDRKPHPIIRNSFEYWKRHPSYDQDGKAVKPEPQDPEIRALVVAARDNQGQYPGYSKSSNFSNDYDHDREANLSAPGGAFLDTDPTTDGCKRISESNTAEINRFKGGIAQTDFQKGRGNVVIICQGTSQAAAHASGVASLVISVLKEGAHLGYDQRIDPDLVISIIEQAAHVSEYRTKQKTETIAQSDGSQKKNENYFGGYRGVDGDFKHNGHLLGHEHPLDAGVAVKLSQAFIRDAAHRLSMPISVKEAEAEVAKVVWNNRAFLADRNANLPSPSPTISAEKEGSQSERVGNGQSQLLGWTPWIIGGLLTCGVGIYLFVKVSGRTK